MSWSDPGLSRRRKQKDTDSAVSFRDPASVLGPAAERFISRKRGIEGHTLDRWHRMAPGFRFADIGPKDSTDNSPGEYTELAHRYFVLSRHLVLRTPGLSMRQGPLFRKGLIADDCYFNHARRSKELVFVNQGFTILTVSESPCLPLLRRVKY